MPPQPTQPILPPTNISPPHSGGGSKPSMGTAITLLFVLGTLAFAGLSIYYITQYNKAKTTVDQQRAEAAAEAKTAQKAEDEAAAIEAAKEPYRSYTAPAVIGALSVQFPKNWNVYATEDQDSAILDVYWNPDVVRSAKGFSGGYNLRVKLEKTLYADLVKKQQKAIEKGEVTAQPVTVSGIAGTRFNGKITADHSGALVVIPLRDRSVSIWTENSDVLADFNQVIERLSIVP